MCEYRTKNDILQVSNITHRIAAQRVSERGLYIWWLKSCQSLPRHETCSWCLDIKFSVSFHLNRDFMTKVSRIRKDQFVVLLIRLKVRGRRVGHGASSEETQDQLPTFWKLKNEAGGGTYTDETCQLRCQSWLDWTGSEMGGLATTTALPLCLHALAEEPVYVFAELWCGAWANARTPFDIIKT